MIKMNAQMINEFYVIGIAMRTSNEDGQSATDIPKLWETFFKDSVFNQIPNKIDSSIYCLYTEYEKDHTKPYTTILGCRVANLSDIPENMVGKTVSKANYTKFKVNGVLAEGIVFNEWVKIWNADLPRSFTTDFEMYSQQALSNEQAEVEICIALH